MFILKDPNTNIVTNFCSERFSDDCIETSENIVKACDGFFYLESEIPPSTAVDVLFQARLQRSKTVSKIVVEVDHMKFDGDEESQNRICRAVTAAIALGADLDTYTQKWVLADNTIANPTIKQLAQALKLAVEEQTKLWTVPHEQ